MPTFNAVDDLGCDNGYGDPVDDELANAAGDNVTIEFPPGVYKLAQTSVITSSDLDNFEMVGLGDSHKDVILRAAPGLGPLDRWMNVQGGTGCSIRNLCFDQLSDEQTGVKLALKQESGLLIEDVEHLGFTPREPSNSGTPDLAVASNSGSGSGTVRRYYNREGGIIDSYPHRGVGIWVSGSHSGVLDFEDCVFLELGGSPIYGSRHSGRINILGGVYGNNDHQDLRIANETGQQAVVRDVLFFGDYSILQTDRGGHEVGERVWMESGSGPILFENCDFFYTDPLGITPAEVTDDLELFLVNGGGQGHPYSGHVTVRNCRFHNDVTDESMFTAPTIQAHGGSLTVENTHFTGASPEAAVESSVSATVRDSCVDMPNGGAINGASTQNVTRGGCTEATPQGLVAVYPGVDSYAGGGPACTSDDECPTTATCQSGSCVYPTPTDHKIVIRGDGSLARYTFVVEGHVEAAGSGDLAGGDFDSISRRSDHEVVEGVTGDTPGTGDTFVFDLLESGAIRDFQFTEGGGVIELDGTEVSPSDFPFVDDTGGCAVDADCPDGEVCVDGECVPRRGAGVDKLVLGSALGLGAYYYLTQRRQR